MYKSKAKTSNIYIQEQANEMGRKRTRKTRKKWETARRNMMKRKQKARGGRESTDKGK